MDLPHVKLVLEKFHPKVEVSMSILVPRLDQKITLDNIDSLATHENWKELAGDGKYEASEDVDWGLQAQIRIISGKKLK
jgi:hypothetical protein